MPQDQEWLHKHLEEFGARRIFFEPTALIGALVNCVSAQTASSTLRDGPFLDPVVRGALLRKVTRDIAAHGLKRHHARLIAHLCRGYPSLPAPKRSACGYCLASLLEVTPPREEERLIRFLLASQHITMRRRAYKHLRGHWSDGHLPTLYRTWLRTTDSEAASVLIQNAPHDWLNEHCQQLAPSADEWSFRRLCIRVGSEVPQLIAALRSVDEISYMYVMTKLGKRVAPAEAREIFERHRHDDRAGLLIWCLGLQGFGEIVADIVRRADEIGHERVALWQQRAGVQPIAAPLDPDTVSDASVEAIWTGARPLSS